MERDGTLDRTRECDIEIVNLFLFIYSDICSVNIVPSL